MFGHVFYFKDLCIAVIWHDSVIINDKAVRQLLFSLIAIPSFHEMFGCSLHI